MKISLNWLSQYINVDEFFDKPESLVSLLTNKGLEVEAVENKSKQYEHVVIGHILERNQHPDADRLTVCQVTTGGGVVHQIVCGAKNHKKGDRVVVSLPGAVLPGNFEIKKSKIRGVESSGMLCSEVELGLATESAGIMILPEDSPIGESFAQYMNLDDIVIEIKVTPNRADCLSHYGLARELATLLDRECSLPIGTIETETGKSDTQSVIKLEVIDTEGCPRYAGRVIRGVKIAPSPKWLRTALEAIGLNSINNVVDVTNYVMMELGQPLHAFDTKNLKGAKIKVSRAERGEKFVSLDGTAYTLDGSELMIRDAERPVAMAGVVGGQNSGVSDDTTELFVECAYFTPSTVRKSSRKHGVQTDSAYRFSRGVDPEGTVLALNRCCELITKVAGGSILGNHYDVYPKPLHREPVTIHIDEVSQRLGYTVDRADFISWMKRLGCRLQERHDDIIITAPTYRADIEIREDLIEEYARLKGYDMIPETVPSLSVAPSPHANQYVLSRMISRRLQSEGFQQGNNLAFVGATFENQILGDRSKLKALGIETPAQSVRVKNPLSEEMNVMRSSLATGLVQNVSHNQRYGTESGRLYEIGFVFEKHEAGYNEDWRLGVVAWGSPLDLWNKTPGPLVLEVKTAMENTLRAIGGRNWSWEVKAPSADFLHPGQTSSLFYEGKIVGYLGALHPGLADTLKLRGPVVVGEFDLSLLLSGQPRITKTKSISKFPAVERDLAFVMPKDLAAQDVATAVKKAAGPQLTSVRVFDVYEGTNLPLGQKSVAFRLVYQDQSNTLTEEQITSLQGKVIEDVTKKLGISVR